MQERRILYNANDNSSNYTVLTAKIKNTSSLSRNVDIFYSSIDLNDIPVSVIINGVTYNNPSNQYYLAADEEIVVLYIFSDPTIQKVPNLFFRNCGYITEAYIPEGFTEVGAYSFYAVSNMKSVSTPTTLVTLNVASFANCSNLRTFYIREGTTSIPESCFEDCKELHLVYYDESLARYGSTLYLPNSVTSIGESAFEGTALLKILISLYVTSIGENPFADLDYPAIRVDSRNSKYYSSLTKNAIIDNDTKRIISGGKDTVIGSDARILGRKAFFGIREGSFYSDPFVIDLNNITTLEEYSIYGCSNLVELDLSNVTTIDSLAIFDCSSLRKITCMQQTAPSHPGFVGVGYYGTLYVPVNSTGYDEWMRSDVSFGLGYYSWTKVEV